MRSRLMIPPRRHLCVMGLSAVLAGCAALAGVALPEAADGPVDCRGDVGRLPVQPLRTLSGGLLAADPFTAGGLPDDARSGRFRLFAPTAVAARGNDVFVIDSARRAVFRFDRGAETVSLFARLPAASQETSLYLDEARSLFVVDAVNREVVQFDRGGRVVERFRNSPELPQPVAVLSMESGGGLLIADGLRAHILAFNRLGGVSGGVGIRADSPRQFQSIADMAGGPNGLYVVDRAARLVHVMTLDGTYGNAFGEGDLGIPTAVAVDAYRRVYVADAADNTIKLFAAGDLEAVIGGAGVRPGRFQQISDLWIDEGLLYVADAGNARIQILSIRPPCG